MAHGRARFLNSHQFGLIQSLTFATLIITLAVALFRFRLSLRLTTTAMVGFSDAHEQGTCYKIDEKAQNLYTY